MNILLYIPASKFTRNVIRDVLYGCWCCGKRIGAGTLPPLSLLSVASLLRQDGHRVKILDSNIEIISKEKLSKDLPVWEAVVVLTSTMTFLEDTAALLELRKIEPSLITVIFGAHPTFMPKYSLAQEAIDIIIRREPEYIIRDLFRNLKNSDSWKTIRGVGYKENGGIHINEDYPYIENLDNLPIPDRSLLPKASYYNPIVSRTPYTTAETSRGCPGRCSFCTAPHIYGGKLRCHSVDRIIEEIEYLLGLGYKEIYYRDETWTTFKARNMQLLSHIIKARYNLTWICNVRVGTVDKETLVLMKKAGCHLIKVGVESGCQRILDKSNKNINIDDISALFSWARKIGLNTHAHLMAGMPGEDKNSLNDTIRFIKAIKPTTIDVGICTPYPGTDLFNEVSRIYPEIGDGTLTSLQNLHIAGVFNRHYTCLDKKEIEGFLRQIYRDFYLSPSYIIDWLRRIKNLNDIRKICYAGINILDFAINGR